MPVISVIVPVYNTEQYLPHCLNSIIAQSMADIEIICVNDGSIDNSINILQSYASRDERIKLINQSNKGQSSARNAALKIASGQYIYFVDSDDSIHNQTLEILYKTALITGSEIVGFDNVKTYIGDEFIDLNDLHYTKHNNPLVYILNHTASSSVIWNKMYRADFIKGFNFIEGIYFEDWPWIMGLFKNLISYTSLPYALYHYNTENASTMRSYFSCKKIQDYCTGINFVCDTYADSPQKWHKVRQKRISNSIKMMINKTYHENCNQPELDKFLLQKLQILHQNKKFLYRELPIKVLLRILKIRLRTIRR